MLKKIVTMLMALCLAAAALVPAFAETAPASEKKVINWDAERQQQFADAGFTGELKAFGSHNICVMIPNDFQQGTLTDESVASGTMAAFLKADGSMIAIAQTKPAGGVTFHNMADKDVSTIMTLLDNGELFTVNCSKLSINKDLYSFVAASLQIKK